MRNNNVNKAKFITLVVVSGSKQYISVELASIDRHIEETLALTISKLKDYYARFSDSDDSDVRIEEIMSCLDKVSDSVMTFSNSIKEALDPLFKSSVSDSDAFESLIDPYDQDSKDNLRKYVSHHVKAFNDLAESDFNGTSLEAFEEIYDSFDSLEEHLDPDQIEFTGELFSELMRHIRMSRVHINQSLEIGAHAIQESALFISQDREDLDNEDADGKEKIGDMS